MRGLLRPGGFLVVGMVEGDLDYVPIPFLGQQLRVTAYPREQLRALLAAEGFDVFDVAVEQFSPAAPDAPPEVQLFMHCRARCR